MLIWRTVNKTFLRIDFLGFIEEFFNDKSAPCDFYVTEGYRTMERSNTLYDAYRNGTIIGYNSDGTPIRGAKGPRAAPAGLSAHNYGCAIDVAPDGNPDLSGLQAVWNISFKGWGWLKLKLLNHPTLASGIFFRTGDQDWPHIERRGWKDYVPWKHNLEDWNRAIIRPNTIIGVV